MITILHMGGGGSREPPKWLRNMCTTPHSYQYCRPPPHQYQHCNDHLGHIRCQATWVFVTKWWLSLGSRWLYLLIIIVLEFLQIHQSNRDLPRKSVDFSEKVCEKWFFLLASSKDSTCRKTLDPSEETQPKWQCLENPLEVPALPTIFFLLLPRAFLR